MTLTTATVADAITATKPAADHTARVCAAVKASCLARMASRFKHADDRLSRALSAALRAGRVPDEDLQLAGYGECVGRMTDGIHRDMLRAARRAGFAGLDELRAAAAERMGASYHAHLLLVNLPADEDVPVGTAHVGSWVERLHDGRRGQIVEMRAGAAWVGWRDDDSRQFCLLADLWVVR